MKKWISLALMIPSVTLGGTKASSIGFANVEEAFEAITQSSEAQVSVQAGWTIATLEQDGKYTLWSFAPKNHPAYPAAIKRQIIERDDGIYIDMKALCQSTKESCDHLIEEFKNLNDSIRNEMQKKS